MRQLKIGVICYPTLGGSGVVATELGFKMAERGHEVHFITSGKPFRLVESHPNVYFHEVKMEGYAVFQYPPYDIALANRIAQVIKERQLDLLHVHYAVPHAISAALGKDMARSSIGVITTLHGTDVTILGHDPVLRDTVRYGIEKSTIVTAVSASLKRETLDQINPNTDIRTIYNFIDEKKYRPVYAEALRTELGIQKEEKVMIHISNFRKVKRIPTIVESFYHIRSHLKAKLLLVGEGPEKAQVEQLVHKLQLDQDVIFTGKRTDLPQLLSISDLMLHLSEKEAFGLVLLEAMACGVPTIATDTGGIPEVVDDGETGFLVPVGEVEEVANKAYYILTNSDVHQRMKQKALEKVHQKFHSSKIVSQYEQLYQEVVEGSS